MENHPDWLSTDKWRLPTGDVDGTFAIGLSFIFLAYFLHPAIESAYQRVRAYRAWRAVEKNKRVDVTTYPLLEEVLGGRNRWDVARAITILLAAFSLASWVLELSMDLFDVENQAYLLTQPPPVYRQDNIGSSPWEVLSVDEINPEYDGNWLGLPNVFEKEAKSRYYVEDFKHYAWSKREDRYIKGEIVVAEWDPDNVPALSYADDVRDTVTVDNVTCSSGQPLKDAPVFLGNERWGSVIECEVGPTRVGTATSQPAIILTEDEGDTHVIVEETSSHPSFLYSVWKVVGESTTTAAGDAKPELAYSFHIESAVRLAEAVVTGIVNGEDTGGGCFGLLRTYSTGPDAESSLSVDGAHKATPFGEDPQDGKVDSLADVEAIQSGVVMNMNALVAFAWLMALSAVGMVWSICLRSSIGMDIYDRDELLRAISLQAQGLADDPEKHAAMRIYVQKEGDDLNVIISESDSDKSGCSRFLLRRARPRVHDEPVPIVDTTNDGFGGAALPRGRPRMYLGGVRSGMGRAWPGRLNNFRYPVSPTASDSSQVPVVNLISVAGTPVPGRSPVLLGASPIPSNVVSAAGTPIPGGGDGTPVPGRSLVRLGASPIASNVGSLTGTPVSSRPGSGTGTPVERRPAWMRSVPKALGNGGDPGRSFVASNGRGVSILFESVHSQDSGNSTRGAEDDPGGGGCGGDVETGSSGPPSAVRPHVSVFGGETKPRAVDTPEAGSNERGGGGGGDKVIGSPVTQSAGRPLVSAFGGETAPGKKDPPEARGGVDRSEVEGGGTEGTRGGNALSIPSDRTTPPVSEGPSPLPSRGLTTDFTLGPPQMGPLVSESVEETKEESIPRPI
ncbi:unnamed protein product [Scytosiphon promiscuus]